MFTIEQIQKGRYIINTQLRCVEVINELQQRQISEKIEPREILNYCDMLEYFNDGKDTLEHKFEGAEILNDYLTDNREL